MASDLESLDRRIQQMHKAGSIHRRRGFRLSDATPELASNHMLEEAVELQAEVQWGNYQSQIEEAADLLNVFLHLLWMSGIPLTAVVAAGHQKLTDNFTEDEKFINPKSGVTRRSREATPNDH